MMKRESMAAFAVIAVMLAAFQNCTNQASFSSVAAQTAGALGGPVATPAPGGSVLPIATPTATPPDTTTTISESLKAFKPVLAVSGINCMACHGVVNASIVTDFGMSSGNFQPNQNFFGGGVRTAFNNVDYTGVGGWGSLTVSGGSVFIPRRSLTKTEVSAMSGINSSLSLAELMKTKINGHSMIDGIKPASGSDTVSEYSNINIAYPTSGEILALVPASLASRAVAVASIQVAGETTSSMSGLAVDSGGGFVRNASGGITCFGDVVIKGPLFLNNLRVTTDDGGCRLYVSQSVFIQGPITYVGTANANLQISSARGIILGISAERLGYAGPTANKVRAENNSLKTAGGPWARLLPSNDSAFSPGNAKINGVASGQFFDNIVIDAVAIGSELLDAGDASAVNNLVAGEMISTEPATGENSGVGGPRVSINYAHLLLNAPHVHSRYGGAFQGTIVADVAMLARNPSAQQIESFEFDPIFEKVGSILPALTTKILTLTK